jgi:UDP-N-acetyl-D-galactosamine dehydrogenase
MLGITFKENCPDVRNTKIVDVVNALMDYGIQVTIYDPWANPAEVMHEYGLETIDEIPNEKFDSVVLAVAHKEFLDLNLDIFKNEKSVVYDVKGVLTCPIDGKL